MNEKDEFNITKFEKEIGEIVDAGYFAWKPSGAVGSTVDPYIAAEKILAQHYGHAKMIEANYTWRAGIRY